MSASPAVLLVKNKDEILIECVRRGLEETRQAGGSAVEPLVACMRINTRIVTMDFGMCVIRVSDEELPVKSRKEFRLLLEGLVRPAAGASTVKKPRSRRDTAAPAS